MVYFYLLWKDCSVRYGTEYERIQYMGTYDGTWYGTGRAYAGHSAGQGRAYAGHNTHQDGRMRDIVYGTKTNVEI